MGDPLCSPGSYPCASVLCEAYGMCSSGTPTQLPTDACAGVREDSRSTCVRKLTEYAEAGVPSEALSAMSAMQAIVCGSDTNRTDECATLQGSSTDVPGAAEMIDEMRTLVRSRCL